MRFFSLATLASAPILAFYIQQISAEYVEDLPSTTANTVSQPSSKGVTLEEVGIAITFGNFTGKTETYTSLLKSFNTTTITNAVNYTVSGISGSSEAALEVGCYSNKETVSGLVMALAEYQGVWIQLNAAFTDDCQVAMEVLESFSYKVISQYIASEATYSMGLRNTTTVCFTTELYDETTKETYYNVLNATVTAGTYPSSLVLTPYGAKRILGECEF